MAHRCSDTVIKVLLYYQCINVLHSIMELILLSKMLKNGIVATTYSNLYKFYIYTTINWITAWSYSCVCSNNFVRFFSGVNWELYSRPDQFLVARAASDQRLLDTIRDYYTLSETTREYQRLLETTTDN